MPVKMNHPRSNKSKSKPGKNKSKQPARPTSGGWAPRVDLQMESESESELIAQPKYEYFSQGYAP
ncbi:hypothetical protein FRC11_004195 [Ceratobasidium sp. 423]|nr:hypothetical protein FRC11_004195 [Ceratobasidium sp. 423]